MAGADYCSFGRQIGKRGAPCKAQIRLVQRLDQAFDVIVIVLSAIVVMFGYLNTNISKFLGYPKILDKMTFGERLKSQRIKTGLTQSSIAKAVGVKATTISNYEKDVSTPNFQVLESITKILGVSGDYLLFGTEGTRTDKSKSEITQVAPDEGGIPLIPIEAMAGFGQGDVQALVHDCEFYIIPLFKGADFLITVRGMSMYPKYSSGDIIACKRVSMTDIFFQWNKVYVLDSEQGALIKRVRKGSKEGLVELVSENPDYQSFEIDLKKVRSVALVMGVIRLE